MKRSSLAASLVLAVGMFVGAASAPAQTTQPVAAAGRAEWARDIWSVAARGDSRGFYEALERTPADLGDDRLSASLARLRESLGKKEADRQTKLDQLAVDLDKALADQQSDIAISKALVTALEKQLVSTDKQAVLNDPRVQELVKRGDEAARSAEARADWLIASELFYRLDALFEQSGKYKEDVERQNHRMAMLRLYVPQRLWELRNARQLAEKKEALPPYNPVGDDFREKLKFIDRSMIVRAVAAAGGEHVGKVPLHTILNGGIEAVRVLVRTEDLKGAFSGLADAAKREQFEARLRYWQEKVEKDAGRIDYTTADMMLNSILDENRKTVGVMDQAILHEFGNGAMERLDPFSAIIWPDELARFQRSTQGRLIGIGVEIQYDELLNIKIVSPFEGAPAQRKGLRTGDLIKKVNGKATYGFTLDQAVDNITGPAGTEVTLTIERRPNPQVPANETDNKPGEFDVKITRAEIPLRSVKGWARNGAREDDWNWYIDEGSRIGYVRLTGFTESTTRDLDDAIDTMLAGGLNGLILDLRFNPGGLLDQAVDVASRFVPSGVIVSTEDGNKRIIRQERATGEVKLSKVPCVVLVNQDSASASEIVSGALQDYAKQGRIKCVLVGQRSYGKGSVQDVRMLLGNRAAMKLTTQHYLLPSGKLIHRNPGDLVWGVNPDVEVEMLPQQIVDAVLLRRDADVMPLDENGQPLKSDKPLPNPNDLLTKGMDTQLQTALLLLQSQASMATAQAPEKEERVVR
ncbi:MAG: S41 family peptidase [Phycisphaerae bacterium]|nr:S41 family peptidase [Phycisphaerae bacterium]